jgi:hypothetical protein
MNVWSEVVPKIVEVEIDDVTIDMIGEGVKGTVIVTGDGVTVIGLKRAAQSEDLAGAWYCRNPSAT